MKNFFPVILFKINSLKPKTKIILLVLAALLIWFYFSLPKTLFNTPTCYVLEDKDAVLLNATIAKDGQWRFPFNEKVPKKFSDCITEFEDKRFYYHPGVDPIAFTRAFIKNMRNKGVPQGGSTISMQVLRLAQKNNKRNLWNKLKESILAVRLECRYSKKYILALYACNAPFGGNVVGLDAAAWRYFGTSPEKLSWGQMATLAVLPNAPSLVHPGKNREVLLRKRNYLLDKLQQANKMSTTDCELAKLEPLPGVPLSLPQNATHLFQRFLNENKKSITLTKAKTTISIALQKNVAAILRQQQAILKGNGINNACALVLDVETGNALAYVGNISERLNPEMESDVDVIAAPRSPGSALKPILYAAMLSEGLILPGTLVPDVPMQIGNYAPKNFDLGYDGAVPAHNALARSLNIPALKMLQQYKYQRFYEVLKSCGITTLNRPAGNYGLSLVLGGCEVTLWDLAGVYASMARTLNHQTLNKGKINNSDFHAPNYLQKKSPNKSIVQNVALDATSLYFTFQAMKEVMRPGEEGLWQQFSSSQTIAWKTGTSFGFRDGWAVGVTPKYVVAVWCGNADGEGRPDLIGIKTAAPVMFDIFRLLPHGGWFKKPVYNFSFVPVCRQSGFKANLDCNDVDTLFVSENGSKSPLCPYHRMVNLDASGLYRVTAECESPSAMQHKSWFVLTPAMEYYYKQKNADYIPLPAFKPGCAFSDAGKTIDIIYPLPNAKIYVPLEINGQRGKTIFSATHRRSNAKIFWSLDDEFIVTTQLFHQVAINPPVGKHTITLVDENGITVTRQFEIVEKEK